MLKDMTKGSPSKLILSFALPMLIGNIFQQLYNMVDSIVVGRFVGKNALAAVGTSFPIMFFLIALVMGLTMGASIIISQIFGAGQMERLRRAVSTAAIFQFFGAILISIIGVLVSRHLLILLKTPDEIIADSAAYLRIIFSGLIFTFAYNILSGILRGLGDSKTPLYFLIISTLLNIVLDLWFVMYWGWGVPGVAWATVIAQGISSIFCIIYIYARVPLLRFSRKDIVFDMELFKLMLRYGIPSSIQQTVVSFGMMAMQGLVNSYGSVTIAAYTAASRIDSIAMMPIMNFGMAVSTFTGQNIGAGQIERVKKGFRSSILMVATVCLSITAVVLLFGTRLIGIFVESSETEVIAIGTEYIAVVSFFYVIMGIMHISNGVLRGSGDIIVPMFSTLCSLATRVICAYWMAASPLISFRGIWWSIPIGWSMGCLLSIIRYFTGRWKEKAVLKNEEEYIAILES